LGLSAISSGICAAQVLFTFIIVLLLSRNLGLEFCAPVGAVVLSAVFCIGELFESFADAAENRGIRYS
jgi:hypothetical protein